jgi:hypothetical protein
MAFFPTLSPEGLLDDLVSESRRDRRRLSLALLEVHGAAARAVAFEKLKVPMGNAEGDESWYYRRNLIYLLRRIPRPPEVSVEEEVDVLSKHADFRLAPPLLRELAPALAGIRHEKSEVALRKMVKELEEALATPGVAQEEREELASLLDRVVGALARLGTPSALKTLADHALQKRPDWGDTLGRLNEIVGQDLTSHPDVVAKILDRLEKELPRRRLGMMLKPNTRVLDQLVAVLAATRAPAVRKALGDVAEKFRDTSYGKAAAEALRAPAAAPPPAPPSSTTGSMPAVTPAVLAAAASASSPAAANPAPSLTGDLEVFGLPSLLQNLSESELSGELMLKETKGATLATLMISKGKLGACSMGHLEGESAFYQVFQRPRPGNFAFTRLDVASPGATKPVMALLLEALRRYDEFERARIVIPDDAALRATQVKPTPVPGEQDGAMIHALWTRASRGSTPIECEADVPADAYRQRRQLQHWIETGALVVDVKPGS